MLIQATDIRVTLLLIGVASFVLAWGIAFEARRLGGIAPDVARMIGAASSVLGWFLFCFWHVPGQHFRLLSPFLLCLTAACPLLAVEAGRSVPFRTFNWVALTTLTAGCACDSLPLNSTTIALQESLLAAGLLLPIPVALIVSIGRLMHWRVPRRPHEAG